MPQDPQASPGADLPIRVLLAEDDDDHVTLLRRAIRGYPREIELTVARDGQEAVEFLRGRTESRPDLILLDMNMPKLTGLEVLRTVKSTDSLDAIPTVMLTTSARDEDRAARLITEHLDHVEASLDFDRPLLTQDIAQALSS